MGLIIGNCTGHSQDQAAISLTRNDGRAGWQAEDEPEGWLRVSGDWRDLEAGLGGGAWGGSSGRGRGDGPGPTARIYGDELGRGTDLGYHGT